jgi:glutamate transport system substrate-binding protein
VVKPPVTIGVANDIPDLGLLNPGDNVRSGFDVELARWLGQNTTPGFTPVFVGVNIEDREIWIADGRLDFVIDVFSITDRRRERVGMAGPYVLTRQGVMTRSGDNKIRNLDDLAGKNVCTIEGSTSLDQLGQLKKDIFVTTEKGNSGCVRRLMDGQVDAFSTDQLILHGFAQASSEKLSVTGISFGRAEEYGVGFPHGDLGTCEMLREGIRNFIIDGAWDQFFRANFPAVDPSPYRPDPETLDACIQPGQGQN